MAFLEQMFQQPLEVYVPVDKPAGSPGQASEDIDLAHLNKLNAGREVGGLVQTPYEVIGKPDFWWQDELSEDGQTLYRLILGEAGDRELLPQHAIDLNFDLEATLAELRSHGVLDEESNPERIRIVRRRP